MAKARAVGERGSWFAKVDGERLPCVHKYWVKGLYHCDPGYIEGEKQWMELVEAIRQKCKVILTKDEKTTELEKKSGVAFSRTGYIAVYSVANVEADEQGLRFELTDRVCDLQG